MNEPNDPKCVTPAGVPWWYLSGAATISLLGIFASIGLLFLWPPQMSMELIGGIRLIYEVADQQSPPGISSHHGDLEAQVTPDLLQALRRRIDPSRMKDQVIRATSSKRIEILLPRTEEVNLTTIKTAISTAGFLQFLIVANHRDHPITIERAKRLAEAPERVSTPIVRNDKGEPVGIWTRVGRDLDTGELKVSVAGNTVRDSATGQILEIPSEHRGDDQRQFSRYLASVGIRDVDVLMGTDDGFDVTGRHLGRVSKAYDERLRPCILFSMSGQGTGLFAALTESYGPQGSFQRQLGIVLDNILLTAPNIQEPIIQGRGRITGSFTEPELEFIINVLEAGSLPVRLNGQPLVEEPVSSDQRAVHGAQGTVGGSLLFILVGAFLLLTRYGWLGVVAVLATANHIVLMLLLALATSTVTLTAIATLASFAVVAGLLHAYCCQCVAGGERVLMQTTLIAVGFATTCVVAGGGYVLGDFFVRNLSLVMLSGVFAGLVVQTCVWLLPTLIVVLTQPNGPATVE